MTFNEYLCGNTYPGRGVLLGKMGNSALIGYFIMGRSTGSRNRVFELDDDGLRTRAFDESKLPDPSLYVYHAVRVFGNCTVVTNGEQTDTVYRYLRDGKTFEDALRTWTYEPDPPILTPRISGLLTLENGVMSYKLSILKSGKDAAVIRQFFEYPEPVQGQAHLIHTYAHDGNPVPSFSGEPAAIDVSGYTTLDDVTDALWNALDENNRVSLFTRTIDLTSGEMQMRVINKQGELLCKN